MGLVDRQRMSDSVGSTASVSSIASDRKSSRGATKKRKFNPDAEAIARTTDETLRTMDVDPNSKEGKRKRRQIRNRLSAQFHRDRKNSHISELETALAEKETFIKQLQHQVLQLEEENKRLRESRHVSSTSLLDSFNQLFPQYFAGMRRLQSAAGEHAGTDNEDTHSLSSLSSSLGGPTHASYDSSNPTTNSASPADSPYHSGIASAASDIHRSASAGTLNGGGQPGVGLSLPGGLARPLTFMSMICMISLMLISQQQIQQSHISTIRRDFSRLVNPEIVDFLSKQFHSLNIQQPNTRGLFAVNNYHNDGAISFNVDAAEDAAAAASVGAGVDHDRSESSAHGRRLQSVGEEPATGMDVVEAEETPSSPSDSDEDENSHGVIAPSTDAVTRAEKSLVRAEAVDSDSKRSSARSGAVVLHVNGRKKADADVEKSFGRVMEVERSHFLLAYTNESLNSAALTWPNSKLRKFNLRGGEMAARNEGLNNSTLTEASTLTDRKLVLSGGLVSRRMVDTSFLAAGTSMTAYYPPAAAAHRHLEDDREDGDGGLLWHEALPVSSYSSMVMTEGKVLLDPALRLGDTRSPVESVNFAASSHTADSSFPKYTSARTSQSANAKAVRNIAFVNPLPPTPISERVPGGKLPADAEAKAVVATSTSSQPRSTYESAYFDAEDDLAETKNLLGHANVMTIKLPASSIRLGSTWGDSENGTVEHIMRAFNISSPPVPPKVYADDGAEEYTADDGDVHYATQAILQNYSADDAAVEINCLILGAKLVLSDPTISAARR